jgi:hypothetical protein
MLLLFISYNLGIQRGTEMKREKKKNINRHVFTQKLCSNRIVTIVYTRIYKKKGKYM